MDTIKILDKTFKTFIPESEIQKRVAAVAEKINHDMAGKNPLLLAVLNGVVIGHIINHFSVFGVVGGPDVFDEAVDVVVGKDRFGVAVIATRFFVSGVGRFFYYDVFESLAMFQRSRS